MYYDSMKQGCMNLGLLISCPPLEFTVFIYDSVARLRFAYVVERRVFVVHGSPVFQTMKLTVHTIASPALPEAIVLSVTHLITVRAARDNHSPPRTRPRACLTHHYMLAYPFD
jgi:hypothetical protein